MAFGRRRACAGIVAVALLALGAPVAGANHGLVAVYEAVAGDCEIRATGVYDSGDGNAQYWVFTVAVVGGNCHGADACEGFGSVEAGFKSTTLCLSTWSLGGTGHLHPYANIGLDAHPVMICAGGACARGIVRAVG